VGGNGAPHGNAVSPWKVTEHRMEMRFYRGR